MWFRLTSFIRFLLKSTNQHGVHSPFIFSLVTNCFYQKTAIEKRNLFKKYKRDLISNHNYIMVTDFGSGSKIFKSNNRKIADIAKVAGISDKKAFLLIRLVNYLNSSTILEIGTSLGLGTSALAIGNPNASIKTMEGCQNTASIAFEQFKNYGFKNISLITGNFNSTLKETIEGQKFDLIYFDGNHQKEATLNYFHRCIPSTNNNSVFIFDDIYWNEEMHETWEEIKQHPLVTVTINTYFWGMVFFRKEQLKQHFTIRI